MYCTCIIISLSTVEFSFWNGSLSLSDSSLALETSGNPSSYSLAFKLS